MEVSGRAWSPLATPSDAELLARAVTGFSRMLAGGVTTLEVKSGYGLTVAQELRGLDLLDQARQMTPLRLVITFLGAHVVPRDLDGEFEQRAEHYTELIERRHASGHRGTGDRRVPGRHRRAGLLHARTGDASDAPQSPVPLAGPRSRRCLGDVAGLANSRRGGRRIGRAPHIHARRKRSSTSVAATRSRSCCRWPS